MMDFIPLDFLLSPFGEQSELYLNRPEVPYLRLFWPNFGSNQTSGSRKGVHNVKISNQTDGRIQIHICSNGPLKDIKAA